MPTETTAPVAVQLRAIAAWLESHPEIEPHYMTLPVRDSDLMLLDQHCVASISDAANLARTAGLTDWRIDTAGEHGELFKLAAAIAPGIRLRLYGKQ